MFGIQQKFKLMKLYELLKQETDEDHSISRRELCRRLNELGIVSNYSQDHPHPDYSANDGFFAPIWDYRFDSVSCGENKLRCWQYTEGWEQEYIDFDYLEFERS